MCIHYLGELNRIRGKFFPCLPAVAADRWVKFHTVHRAYASVGEKLSVPIVVSVNSGVQSGKDRHDKVWITPFVGVIPCGALWRLILIKVSHISSGDSSERLRIVENNP